jgi:hypothetical protein
MLNKLLKSSLTNIKTDLHDIWITENRDGAYRAFNCTLKRDEAKYPKGWCA